MRTGQDPPRRGRGPVRPVLGTATGTRGHFLPLCREAEQEMAGEGLPLQEGGTEVGPGDGRGVPGVGKRLLGVRCQPGDGRGACSWGPGPEKPQEGIRTDPG